MTGVVLMTIPPAGLSTPSPHISHNPSHTYPPSEDTYHLLDVLSSPSQVAFLATRFPPSTPAPSVLEVGVGTGIVLAFLTAHAQTIFGRADVLSLGTDVNALACATAIGTVNEACEEAALREEKRSTGTLSDVVTGDLTSPLRGGMVDMLVFNPPYVPSETLPELPTVPSSNVDTSTSPKQSAHDTFTEYNSLLALATDGGAPDGMEVTRRLMAQLPAVLSRRGVAYVLLCARNRPKDVLEGVEAWEGGGVWKASVVGESGGTAGWERLCVVRVERILERGND